MFAATAIGHDMNAGANSAINSNLTALLNYISQVSEEVVWTVWKQIIPAGQPGGGDWGKWERLYDY